MKCSPIIEKKISSIIEDLMVKYSRWEFIKNVLARVIYFADVKLNNFQEAQEKAEKTIFIQYQNAASEYLKAFKGSPYYLST